MVAGESLRPLLAVVANDHAGSMNGAEALMTPAAPPGVTVCFPHPGTTELAFLPAIDATPGMRGVLGLFEGVCSGAADGYARMAGRPALVLLHLGPGLGNAIANLHNARKARSPVVVLVGDHPPEHAALDPPLHSEIATLAAPVSGWLRASKRAAALPGDAAEAIAAAWGSPGQVATVIVPEQCQRGAAEGPAPVPPRPAPRAVPGERVDRAAEALRRPAPAALLLGGPALTRAGLRAAGRIAARTGCRLLCEGYPARVERGGDLPFLERIPYFPEQQIHLLTGLQQVIL